MLPPAQPTPQAPLIPEPLTALAAVFPGLRDLTGCLALRSLEEYTRIAGWYLAWCTATSHPPLDPQSLRAWRQHLVHATRLSPNTINTRLAGIKTLVTASAACGALDRMVSYDFSLVEKVKRSALRHRLKLQQHRRYTPQDIRRLCKAPNAATVLGLRDRALLATLASSGCRIAEAVSLTQDHIVPFEAGWALQILGKGQATARQALLSQEAYTWITRWLEARHVYVRSAWIFTDTKGQPLHKHSAYKIVRRYAQRVGLPQFTPHDFRRFCGTEIAAKYGLREAQKVLGHQNLNTTQQYYLLDPLQPELTNHLY